MSHLDGSALGMLLVLEECADALHKRVILSRCRGIVRQALETAHLGRLFGAP